MPFRFRQLGTINSFRSDVGASGLDPALVRGAVKDDAEHPQHMSVRRYLACEDTVANARLFLWHSLRLNQHFVGDGWTIDPELKARVEEHLTGNVPLSSIPGHRIVNLDLPPLAASV